MMLKQIILMLCVLSWCNNIHAKESESSFKYKELEAFDIADDIPIFDIEGNKHFLEEYEGKTVLLVFWATWCSPCTNEMVDLDLLQKDFRKLAFVILPISEDFGGIDVAKKFYESYSLRHIPALHDYKNALFKELGLAGMPTSILINSDGKAIGMFTGSVPWYDEKVRNILLSNIAGNPVVPKNSHRDQSLNQRVATDTPTTPETAKAEEPAPQKDTEGNKPNDTKTNKEEKIDDAKTK